VSKRRGTRHCVREFWVVDANERTVVKRGPDDALTAPALPGFSIRLSEID
jgi:hypothetical protein